MLSSRHSPTPATPDTLSQLSGVLLTLRNVSSQPRHPTAIKAAGVLSVSVAPDAPWQCVVPFPAAIAQQIRKFRILGESELPVVTVYGPEALSTQFPVSSDDALTHHPAFLDGEWAPPSTTPDWRVNHTRLVYADLTFSPQVSSPVGTLPSQQIRLPRGEITILFDVRPSDPGYLPLLRWIENVFIAGRLLSSAANVFALPVSWTPSGCLDSAEAYATGWLSRPTAL